MDQLAELVAPLDAGEFKAKILGRQPVHMSLAGCDRASLLSFDAFNALLTVQNYWEPSLLLLVKNGEVIGPEYYCDADKSAAHKRLVADPAKVNVFLGMGVTMVANHVQQLSSPIARICELIQQEFCGIAAANVYFSSKGATGFGVHYDVTDVFVIQTEGEKIWRLFRNRADTPLAYPDTPMPQLRAYFAATCGPVEAEVHLRPGDVLYVPRGFYHDPVAVTDHSLHVTISLTPQSGLDLFDLLKEMASADPAFRAYLPITPVARAAHLAELSTRLADMMRSPELAAAAEREDRKVARQRAEIRLPHRPSVTYYQATRAQYQLSRQGDGVLVETARGRASLTALEVANWILTRPGFAKEELAARFGGWSDQEIEKTIAAFLNVGLIAQAPPAI